MPIPEFNEIKAPALEFFADGKTHKLSELFGVLGERFKLTEQELSELLPSGTQSRWHNRANWACYDLYRAGLLNRPKKGIYVISELGKQVVGQRPTKIDREFLMQFPPFVEFIKKSTKASRPTNITAEPISDADLLHDKTTPEEQMAALADSLRTNLASDLLEQVKEMNPFRFERLVLDLLLAMGYGGSRAEAAIAGKGVSDGGIDGLINEDRLGLDRIYVQAKRWQQNSIGRPEIQNFVGALAGQHAHKGIFITTSEFSGGAVEYVRNLPQRVILIDGERLAELMIEHNIGVSRAYAYEVKRIDSDYFEES